MPVSQDTDTITADPRRFLTIWMGVVFVASLILCFIPLFNLLAFEFAFAISIPLSLGAGLFGAKFGHEEPSGSACLKGLAAVSLAALTPITLNALRVQNCDYLEGACLFLLFAVVTTVVSALWGGTLSRVTRHGVKAFLALWFAALIMVAYTYYTHPPVDLYSPFLGYWPGAIYDDVFRVEAPLLWSRLEDLTFAGGAYLLVRLYESELSKRWVLTTGLIVICGLIHWGARQAGVYRNAEFIQHELGGERKTPRLEVYYPAQWSTSRIDRIVAELEFAHAELTTFFGTAPKPPITVYLYADQRMKKHLMGARRTAIAKPWQWTFHVDRPAIDRSVIVHEMAHVFAAQFSGSFLKVPLGPWFLPNMALIEGIAEAATWRGGALDLHQWSAALKQLGIAPPIGRLLEPKRFYGQHSRTAYTLCGSLYRFVHDEFGKQTVRSAYETGDFSLATGLATPELIERWDAYLNKIEIPNNALSETRALYDRPAIFGRVCAREIASLRRSASGAIAAGRRLEALQILDEILGHLARDVRSRMTKIRLLIADNRLQEAKSLAQSVVGDEHAGGRARSLAQESLADIALLQGAQSEANTLYTEIEKSVFARGRLRALVVKKASLGQPVAQQVVRYLYGAVPKANKLETTEKIAAAAPEWPVGSYLRGRARLASKDYPGAIEDLKHVTATETNVALRFESWRLMAHLAFTERCYNLAAQAYAALSNRDDLLLSQNELNSLKRWVRRSRFFSTHFAASQHTCTIEIDIASKPVEDSAKPGNSERAPSVDNVDWEHRTERPE